jgi:Flp pilus assembly protein TadD
MSDVDARIARFERYVELDPQNATVWVGYGDALHGAGLLDRAEEAFRKSLTLQPGNAVASARLAALDISRQNFTQAEHALRRLIDGGERHPVLRFNLGLALYYQRRFPEALEVFEGVAASPEAPDARYYLVSCLHNLASLDEGIARAEAFLAERTSPKLQGYLALMLMDAGRMDEALVHARAVIAEVPDNPDAAAVLGTDSLERLEMEEAERHLQALVGREPRNVRGLQGLALVALHRQQHDDAIAWLTRARESDPGITGTLATLGWVHLTRHDYAHSERIFREGLEVDRSDAELHGGLAAALLFQHRLDEARQEIAKAFGLDKHCFGATVAQSVLLRLEGRERVASKLFADMLASSTREGGPTLLDGMLTFMRRQAASSRRGAPKERP